MYAKNIKSHVRLYTRGTITSFLFEVTYYRNRINLEVFHVLTDGTGAMNFLKTLVSNYLTLAENVEDSGVDYDASSTQKVMTVFQNTIPAKFLQSKKITLLHTKL